MRPGTIGCILLAAILLVGCGGSGKGSRGSDSTAGGPTAISDERVVRAVHDHLVGKTYAGTETDWVDNVISCTQLDHDLDALGTTCRGSGGLYGYGTKVDRQPTVRNVQLKCPAPPPIDSSSWGLDATGDDSWRVWNTQGSWNVAARSDGSFAITANQNC